MTSVNMPRDNAADRIDAKATAKISVKEVSPYPAIEAEKPHEDVTKAPQAPRRPKPRKSERRKKKQKILLDTRSGRDRRNAAHTDSTEVETDKPAEGNTGIDVYS